MTRQRNFNNKTPLPPLRGTYAIRNPVLNALFRLMDCGLRVTLGSGHKPTAIPTPRRILMSNVAHLGDVVMATSVLPVLKSAFPDAEIGFLVGSWSRAVVQDHPIVKWVHTFDHAMHSRSAAPFWRKIQQHRQTRSKALREIRAVGYDVAIDLYWNFPNTLPLLWHAGIPVRIGYSSGGFGSLATHSLIFKDTRQHVSQRHMALIRVLPVSDSDASKLRPILPSVCEWEMAALSRELQAAGVGTSNYIVFHVAGLSVNKWLEGKWRSLAKRFSSERISIVFTGAGADQKALIERITRGLPRCVNLCDRLDWQGFVAAIQGANLLICADTVAGHVAGALGTPCVVITAGRWPYLWRPLGEVVEVMTHPTPCTPCHRNYGCATMDCIRNVGVGQVYEAGVALMEMRAQKERRRINTWL